MTSMRARPFVVAVRGARTDHQMTAGGGVVPEPGQQRIVGDQQARHDQHRQVGGDLGGVEASPSGPMIWLSCMIRAGTPASKVPAIEGLEDAVVRPLVDVGERGDEGASRAGGRRPGRPVPTWNAPSRAARPDASGWRPTTREPARCEVGAEPAELGVDPAGLLVVRQDPDPVRLGAEVVGVPVPVLDHLRAAGDEGPRGLPPLAVERREVGRRAADGAGVGLGDQERRLLGGVHPIARSGTGSRLPSVVQPCGVCGGAWARSSASCIA